MARRAWARRPRRGDRGARSASRGRPPRPPWGSTGCPTCRAPSRRSYARSSTCPSRRATCSSTSGAGLGKAAMAVHLLTGARARGIELQPELVAAARAQARELGLDGVSFVETDALDARSRRRDRRLPLSPLHGRRARGRPPANRGGRAAPPARPLLAGARPARRRLVRRAADRGVLAVESTTPASPAPSRDPRARPRPSRPSERRCASGANGAR